MSVAVAGATPGAEASGVSKCNIYDHDDLHKGQHPALKSLCVVDCEGESADRIFVPNSEPAVINTECFDGLMMLMIRTPDVDDPKQDVSTFGEGAKCASDHFRQYKRRFEFQFQIKFKKLPTGPLFLGTELEDSLKLGRLTKGLVGVLMTLVQRKHTGFHFSWGVEELSKAEHADPATWETGTYQKTHLSFPVDSFMDIIQITKPGEKPPTLGKDKLHESVESFKRRRKTGVGAVEWNLEDTYSMCLYSAYMDWIQWKALNLPGIRPFPVQNLFAKQPIYLTVYEIPNHTSTEYKNKRPNHYRKDMIIYTRLEFSNFQNTEGGKVQKLLREGKIKCSSESGGTEPDNDS